jgi:hypothetical protein
MMDVEFIGEEISVDEAVDWINDSVPWWDDATQAELYWEQVFEDLWGD